MSDRPVTTAHPAHYARFAIEPIDFIAANNIGFAAGNVIKYVCRQDAKDGLKDLQKARYYLDKMIEAATPKPKPKRRKARVKVVTKYVDRVRGPTYSEIKAAFPSLSKAEVDRAIVGGALDEMQKNPTTRFRAYTPWPS